MATDFLVDENGDALVRDGDFVVGESIDQEVSLILKLNQGELLSDPLLGPNLKKAINSNMSAGEIKQIIKLHLGRDGKEVRRIEFDNGTITLDAEQR